MAKIQEKLKECIGEGEGQSRNSLERLSEVLGSEDNPDVESPSAAAMMTEAGQPPGIDADETIRGGGDDAGAIVVSEVRGENKVPASKRSRRKNKHRLARRGEKPSKQRDASAGAEKQRKRPRYYCEF